LIKTSAIRLGIEDVERLEGASSQARASTAVRVAQQIDQEGLTPSERQIAEDIVRLFACDAEVIVRRSLAEQVKASPHLPHDVALKLARDVDEVALPVIEFASVLTDDDCIEIVRSGAGKRQSAVAVRSTVSSRVAREIIEVGHEDPVARLVANSGANISDVDFDRIIARFPGSYHVSQALVGRAELPIRIVERLFTAISNSLRRVLMARPDVSAEALDAIVLHARERATIDYIAAGAPDEQVEALVRHLHAEKRLTPSLVVRSLLMADATFFAAAMAVRASISVFAAWVLLEDPGPLGLKVLFQRARMPYAHYSAVRAAVDALIDSKRDGCPHDNRRVRRQIVERVLNQVHDLGEDTLNFLVAQLARLESEIRADSVA
jgi:uncharacterized protein (DUF2336 family)